MKKYVVFAVSACLLFAAAGQVLAVEKPLVVLSLASHNAIQSDASELGDVGKAKEMPTWLGSMLKLFAEGKNASGLDASRPWGAVIQLGDDLSAFGFVPITDAESLSWEIYSYIKETIDLGNNTYKIIGTESGKELYAKDCGQWLFVSDSPKTLESVPSDPTRLLGGLNRQYDLALRFELKNIPSEQGQEIIALLDKTLGPVLRQHASEATMDIIGEALDVLDQATLGWSEHH
jgi:hypothetical protein